MPRKYISSRKRLDKSSQVNPGRAQECMNICKEATSRLKGHLMLDRKPTTQDDHRIKTNVLQQHGGLQQQFIKYIKVQSYRQLQSLTPCTKLNKKFKI